MDNVRPSYVHRVRFTFLVYALVAQGIERPPPKRVTEYPPTQPGKSRNFIIAPVAQGIEHSPPK